MKNAMLVEHRFIISDELENLLDSLDLFDNEDLYAWYGTLDMLIVKTVDGNNAYKNLGAADIQAIAESIIRNTFDHAAHLAEKDAPDWVILQIVCEHLERIVHTKISIIDADEK